MKKSIQKRKKNKVYIGIIIGLIVLLLFMMPILYVHEVNIMNNQHYTAEEIKQIVDLENKHLLSLSMTQIREELLALPYIQEVMIMYHFPGKITIDIVEKTPFVYVEFSGSYLCLNEQGQVIDQSNMQSLELPIIVGLDFDRFKVTETLPIKNIEQWLCAVDVVNVLKNRDYVEKIKRIDVYNLEEIHLYVDKLDVIMGDISDFDKKIDALIEIHHVTNMGKLDLTTFPTKGEAYLTPIT